MLMWAHYRGVTLRSIDLGSRIRTPYVESFNGRFRDECPNEHLFTSLAHARSSSKRSAASTTKNARRRDRRADARRIRETADNERGIVTAGLSRPNAA
jgi:hypothetical protein